MKRGNLECADCFGLAKKHFKTTTFATTLDRKFLPIQLTFKVSTTKTIPSLSFPPDIFGKRK